MSRRYQEDYKPEVFSDSDDTDDENEAELDNYAYVDNLYRAMTSLKEYSQSNGLPLCQHLNFDLLVDFLNRE